MGIYDRDYNRHNYSGGDFQRQFCMPPLTPTVKWLLIINVAVYFVSVMLPPLGIFIYNWFSVSTRTVGQSLQLWRIISYQFLHADLGHIFGNMLILYFFGPMLEQLWGSRRFLKFYLICGAMGGIVYPVLSHSGFPGMGPGNLVGASGAILGMLAAAAILFPRMRVYIFGVFPIPMLVLAGILVLISIMGLMGDNVGGEVAHLSGMAAGAVYVLYGPWIQKKRVEVNKGRWEKKISDQRNFQQEVDRILTKVHETGINSLTRKEKRTLKEATEREQER